MKERIDHLRDRCEELGRARNAVEVAPEFGVTIAKTVEEAVTALLGRHIEAVVSTDFGPQLQAGKVRLLVETGPLKAPGHAHIKTYRELNYPLSPSVFYGLIGPAKLAPDVVRWWEDLCRELTSSREFTALVEAQAGLVSFQGSAEFSAAVRRAHSEAASTLAKPAAKQ